MADLATTAVMSVGYDAPAMVGGAAVEHVFRDVEHADLNDVSDVVDRVLQRGGHVVIVYPEWYEDATVRRLETVRAILGSDRLILYGCALPPLAGGVLCNLAAALAPQLTQPGQLVAALGDLGRELIVLAWLGSLRGLKQPAPSVMQHLVSLWPGTSYGVLLQPEHAIVRIDRSGGALPVHRTSRPIELVVAAQEDCNTSWLRDTVIPALGDAPIRTVAPTADGPRWWGTARLVEAVVCPTVLPELVRDLAIHNPLRTCGWCSNAIASTPCPFCRGCDQPSDEPAAVAGSLHTNY